MEDRFFFLKYYQVDPEVAMKMPVHERKWFIQRYLVQHQREMDEIEKLRKRR